MTDRAKKFGEFTAATTVEANSLFVIVDASSNTTKKVTFSTIRTDIIEGPYANDAAANTAGVEIGHMYYTAAGDVKIRLV